MWELRDAVAVAVAEGEKGEGEEGGLEIVATARVEANMFVARLMLPAIRKAHEDLVHRFVERVKREEVVGGGDG